MKADIDQARACIEQMQAALVEDRWDDIEPLDHQCRLLVDNLINTYEQLSEDGQKELRVAVSKILSQHRQLLIDCKERLENLRTEIAQNLHSEKVTRAYRDNG